MIQSRSDFLDKVIAPLTITDFFQQFWEKKPLHIERARDEHFSCLLGSADIEKLLATQDLYFPDVQLTQASNPIPSIDYVDNNNKIIPLRFIQHYSAGATIVVSQAHRRFTSLSGLTRSTQLAVQMRCQANVYLSPPENQGFNTHYDTHDVFILQLSGRKTFRFYSSTIELPFAHEKYNSETAVKGSKTEEILLNPGDTLYIPRGIMHDAVAEESQPSLHITLGVFPIIIHDVMQQLIQIAAEKNVQLRHSIPVDAWAQESGERQALQNNIAVLLNECTVDNLSEAMSRMQDDVAMSSSQDSAGLLLCINRSGNLELNTRIAIKYGSLLNVERQGLFLKLRLFGLIVEFEEPMSTAVEWLVKHSQCNVGELTGLSDSQQIALAQRLLRENIVEIVAQA